MADEAQVPVPTVRITDDKKSHSYSHAVSPIEPPTAAQIVEQATVAAIATDRNNVIIACNRHASSLLERRSDEVVGQNFQLTTSARDVFGNSFDQHHAAFHEMVHRFDSLQSFKMDLCDASGRRMRVGASIMVVLASNMSDYNLVYLLTPIRRRRRADQLIDQLLAGMGLRDDPRYFGEDARGAADAYQLTGRQREVLHHLADGKKAAEISAELGVSINTVRSHIRSILGLLEVSSQLEAVAKALALRII